MTLKWLDNDGVLQDRDTASVARASCAVGGEYRIIFDSSTFLGQRSGPDVYSVEYYPAKKDTDKKQHYRLRQPHPTLAAAKVGAEVDHEHQLNLKADAG
jgi:hypothetical protein